MPHERPSWSILPCRNTGIACVIGLFFLICASSLPSQTTFVGEPVSQARQCGVTAGVQSVSRVYGIGGLHLTSRGVLRVLVVFASFPDDETPHPYWPAHQPPLFMQQFIDPDTTTRSGGSWNLTNYFRRMSLGQFQVVGEAIWVESAHSQEEYRSGAYGRANSNVLQESVDPLVDFSLYDQWTANAAYSQTNAPDGQVDMIIMVWRTSMFEYVGEASLGHAPGFSLDGKRIETGFPESVQFPLGSGLTCEYLYTDGPAKVMRTIVHEVGHWLLGGPHPYNGLMLGGKHSYWGMLCEGHRLSSCANAYERERLGWISVAEIQPDANTPLPDFLSTGVARKYHLPNGDPEEYFYIENHQQLSDFDDVTANAGDRGIWILHQQGPYMELDNLRIRPSDGNWNWGNPGVTTACFSQQLPVFTRGVPRVLTGESHRDQISTRASALNWMHVYKDNDASVSCGAYFAGEKFSGAFTPGSVFSPYSNPNSNTWDNQQTPFSLEMVDDANGVITVRFNSSPLGGPPARRYLGVDPADTLAGWVSLAWGTQWPEGQPLEADVDSSELERRIGAGGAWERVYQGPATSWRDRSIAYDTNGTVPVSFRIRAHDTQGNYSSWSNVFTTATGGVNGVDHTTGGGNETPARATLEQNYPNPFNPSTTITFALPAASHVRLLICDLLGREIRRLVDAPYGGGFHTVRWDATDDNGAKVTSGVYFYRIQAGTYSAVRRMLLVR